MVVERGTIQRHQAGLSLGHTLRGAEGAEKELSVHHARRACKTSYSIFRCLSGRKKNNLEAVTSLTLEALFLGRLHSPRAVVHVQSS